ncbi:MAG: outer membrane lipid asymmetry maintenance protein MlaD [Pseudomonadota bacterium]|nr:outer membrane lipid asymmetry maintenance protein MlaD [Pseudomonadota bacterium]
MNRAGIFETVVGVVVLAVAALFLAYAYRASGQESERGAYKLDAVFGRVDGVTVGAEVRIAGVKVGSVTANRLDPKTYEARVQLAVSSGVPVPEDSIAKIVSDGLLGGAHVSIEPGASDVMLKNGDQITLTQGSVDLLGLAVQAFTSNAGKGDQAPPKSDPLGDL